MRRPLTLLLLALSPWMLASFFSRPQAPRTYRGILTMWHITDWRTGGSSITAFLQRRIAAFEAEHPHVFIELETMSAAQASIVLRESSPDLISYPSSFLPAADFAPLPPQNIIPAFAHPDSRAYPYLLGGYCIMVNTEILNENGIDAPDGWGIRPDALAAAAAYGIAFAAEPGYSPLPAPALHAFPDAEGPNINTWGAEPMPDIALNLAPVSTDDPLASFCSSDVCVLIASHRQFGEVTSAFEQADAPAFAVYAIGGYTDMAQYISVIPGDNPLQQDMCAEFASYLVSARVQKKTSALGVFPAVPGLEVYSDDACRAAMYRLLCDSPAYAPPDNAKEMDRLAREAFGGNKRALRQLRRMLQKGG